MMDILIVDDYAAMREEIMSLIEEHEDLDVVGQATGGKDGVLQAEELCPDVVVMDLVMPGMNGIDATRAIHDSHPEIHVLALSNHTGRDLVEAVIDAGASGYVCKDRAYEELIPAIRAITDGRRYIGEHVKD